MKLEELRDIRNNETPVPDKAYNDLRNIFFVAAALGVDPERLSDWNSAKLTLAAFLISGGWQGTFEELDDSLNLEQLADTSDDEILVSDQEYNDVRNTFRVATALGVDPESLSDWDSEELDLAAYLIDSGWQGTVDELEAGRRD